MEIKASDIIIGIVAFIAVVFYYPLEGLCLTYHIPTGLALFVFIYALLRIGSSVVKDIKSGNIRIKWK